MRPTPTKHAADTGQAARAVLPSRLCFLSGVVPPGFSQSLFAYGFGEVDARDSANRKHLP